MDESSLSGWAGMSGSSSPYASDNASLQAQQESQNILMGATTGVADPSITGQMQAATQSSPSYIQPSSVNGYPMFSSSTAGQSSPSGYANSNPIDNTPSVIAQQARLSNPGAVQGSAPNAPVQATMNPWNIKNSSQPGSFDYPMGQNVAPPKLNVL